MGQYVYILQSLKDNRYYIGYTTDVEARLNFHNVGWQRSTRHRIPFRLVLVETYTTKKDALQREKQIKSWKGGNAFHALISGTWFGTRGRRFSRKRRDVFPTKLKEAFKSLE